MKSFITGIIFLGLVGVAAYVGLKYYYEPPTDTKTYKSAAVTKTGILQKTTVSQSDFTHVIVSSGGSVGVSSYTLNLDEYIGKKVSVTGQFSGNTLYADSISVSP